MERHCCDYCRWYDITVPTLVVRGNRSERGYKCSITGRSMFKSDGKKCKNFSDEGMTVEEQRKKYF